MFVHRLGGGVDKLAAVVALYPQGALLVQEVAGGVGGGQGAAAGHKDYLIQAAVGVQSALGFFHHLDNFLHTLDHDI